MSSGSCSESVTTAYFPASQVNNGTGAFTLPFDLSYEVGRVRRTVSASREEAPPSAADLQTANLSLHSEVASITSDCEALTHRSNFSTTP
jgi:outer membrane protein TolC